MNSHTLGVDPLRKGHYDTWSDQAQSVLQMKKLWSYCSKEPTAADIVNDQEKHLDAIAVLRLIVDKTELRRLKGVTSGYEAWERLKQANVKEGPAHGMKLFRKLLEKCNDPSKVRTCR